MGDSGTILTTADGGATWLAQVSGTDAALRSVAFVDAARGWAVGNYGTILTTVDGGATWASQTSGTEMGLNSVAFADAARGWAVGNGGTILTTADGGATWGPQVSGAEKWLGSVAFVDAARGWAVGERGTILIYHASALPRKAATVPTAEYFRIQQVIIEGAAVLDDPLRERFLSEWMQLASAWKTTNDNIAKNDVALEPGPKRVE